MVHTWIPALGMLLLQAVLLLLALPSPAEDTPTEGPGVLIPLTKEACQGWMAGIPGHPGHNGTPGRDGRDGTPGEKGEKGDAGKNKSFGFLHQRPLWEEEGFQGYMWTVVTNQGLHRNKKQSFSM